MISQVSVDDGNRNNKSACGNGSDCDRNNGFRTTKQTLKDLEKKMDAIGLKGEVEMAKKLEPGVMKVGELVLESNVFGVRLPERQIFRYDVTVKELLAHNRTIKLKEISYDDHNIVERSQRYVKIFKSICKHEFFAQTGQLLYYDGQKIMYALIRLPIKNDQQQIFKVDPKMLDFDLSDNLMIEFIVSEVPEDFVITLNDLSHIACQAEKINRTLLQFIDIATSQSMVMNPDRYVSFRPGITYLKYPLEEGFTERSCPEIDEGKMVAVGALKSACAVEGPRGRGSTSIGLIIDTAKTAFHRGQNVLDKAIEIFPHFMKERLSLNHIKQLKKQLKGLFAETVINNKRSKPFRITEIIAENARQITFNFNNCEISIEQYYRNKYNMQLKFPEAPLLESRDGTRKSYFPMEISYIIPGQRVRQSQQTSQQLKAMKDAKVIPPKQRANENLMNMEAMGIVKLNNPWIAGAGIEMKSQLKMISRILPAPSIQYKNEPLNINPFNASWCMKPNTTYIRPGTIKIWALYAIKHNARSGIGLRDMRKFAQFFFQACKTRGMSIEMPNDMSFVKAGKEDVESCIRNAAKHNAQFIFFIQEDNANLHDFIKTMERKYVVITQDMKMSRVSDIINKGKWQMLENVIHKTNVKLGGVNYELSPPSEELLRWLEPGRLFIGLSISHFGPPTAAESEWHKPSNLSVIGYAANVGSADSLFIGDFSFYEPSRNDMASLVTRFVSQAIERYQTSKRSSPSQVIIYRGGISESEFPMIMKYEVLQIRQALQESHCDKIPLTLIVVNRMHYVRLVPLNASAKDKASEQNIKPGCVVDQYLVHPRYCEFYLNSHKTLQGTAKTPRYTVLVDDNKFSMDDLEGMTYSLCFCHQIVTTTTSLPTPLYVAGLYAERGRRLLKQFRNNDADSAGDNGDTISMEVANEALTYQGTKLAKSRINA